MCSKPDKRHSRRWWLGVVSLLPPIAVWAQNIDIDALVSRADAIVSVEVAFVPYGDLVIPGQVLHGEPIAISSPNELLGDCLPSKAVVRELAKQATNTPQAAVYAEALERASYSATVFLKREADRVTVICDASVYSTQNWERDPRYRAFRAQLQDHLNDRSR